MELSYKLILEELKEKSVVVWAGLVGHQGSSPRHSGSQMIVNADSSIIGTVGGGALEGRVIQLTKDCLDEKAASLQSFALTAESSSELGMTCGGNVEVLLETMSLADKDLVSYLEKIVAFIQNRERGRQLIIHDNKRLARLLLDEANNIVAEYGLASLPEAELLREKATRGGWVVDATGWRFFQERIGPRQQCIIFGCGHVGQETAYFAHRCDFEVVAIDDRPEFADSKLFPETVNVLCQDYHSVWDDLKIDEQTYLVIVTRGHQHDEYVLRQALTTKAKYIGMIGSRTKVAGVMSRLRTEGMSEAKLASVFSPIGEKIGAETPAEIAVSIMAEIIRVSRYREK